MGWSRKNLSADIKLKTVTIEVAPYFVEDDFYFILLHSLENPNREYMGG